MTSPARSCLDPLLPKPVAAWRAAPPQPAPSPISLQTNPEQNPTPWPLMPALLGTWGAPGDTGTEPHHTTGTTQPPSVATGNRCLGGSGAARSAQDPPVPGSSTGFGGKGRRDSGPIPPHPPGSANPRLLHRQFPFLTQCPLAVRADLRALVKSADSSLAGGQRHLGLAENTSLRGLGEKQQPEERSSQPSRERLRAGRTLGHRPSQGQLHTPHPQQGCRHKEGTPGWQNTLPSGHKAGRSG